MLALQLRQHLLLISLPFEQREYARGSVERARLWSERDFIDLYGNLWKTFFLNYHGFCVVIKYFTLPCKISRHLKRSEINITRLVDRHVLEAWRWNLRGLYSPLPHHKIPC